MCTFDPPEDNFQFVWQPLNITEQSCLWFIQYVQIKFDSYSEM